METLNQVVFDNVNDPPYGETISSVIISEYDGREVNILGATYTIRIVTEKDYSLFENKTLEGACNFSEKIIRIRDIGKARTQTTELSVTNYTKLLLRHEITHAFLVESGLNCNALTYNGPWCHNEEMVDWIAIQTPKIMKVFEELDLIF